MSDNTAPQRPAMVAGEVRADSVSFAGKLDTGETLTGTPTAVAAPAGLTCASPTVNVAALVINGRSVAIGKAVTYTASGGTAGIQYTVTLTCQTSHGQTLIGRVIVPVEA